jgi:TonB family protein
MKRSLDFRPKSATWVQRLIGNYSQLMVFPDEKVSRVYNDSHARCVELRGGDEQRALCFEAGGLLRNVQLQAENTTYQYSDYMKFGEKWFPKTLKVTTRGRLVVDAKLDELAAEDAPYPGLFVPPAGAREGEGCQSPVPARLIEKVQPSYPPLARQERRSGTVTLYARIASDGTVQDLRVIETAGRDLDDAALSAVKQWKYVPFMCGDHAVAQETNITVIFSLPNR